MTAQHVVQLLVFFFSLDLFIQVSKNTLSTSSPPPNTLPLPPLPPLPLHLPHHSPEQSSQGFLPCGKSKFLPPPSRSRKVSIQTGQDPKKPVHADETRPSAIVNGFSVFIWTLGAQSAPMSTTFRESGLITCSFSSSPAGLGELPLDQSHRLSGWMHPSGLVC